MPDNTGSKVTYFMVGLGIGALVGLLFAPKSGEETRDYLSQKADEGREFAQRNQYQYRYQRGAAAPLLNAVRDRSARDAVRSAIERLTGGAPRGAVPAVEQSAAPAPVQ